MEAWIPSEKGAILGDFLSIEKHCKWLLSNIVCCTFARWRCGTMARVSIYEAKGPQWKLGFAVTMQPFVKILWPFVSVLLALFNYPSMPNMAYGSQSLLLGNITYTCLCQSNRVGSEGRMHGIYVYDTNRWNPFITFISLFHCKQIVIKIYAHIYIQKL